MKNAKTPTLLTWLLIKPIKYAICIMCLFILVSFIYGMFNSNLFSQQSQITLGAIITLLCGLATLYFAYRMPRIKMDRFSFVALHNAQNFIISVAFILTAVFILTNYNQALLYLMWMDTQSHTMVTLTIIAIALFYLYIIGLFISNVYIKFMRAREMKIPTWKIICSMPFGFSLIWIPGYMLESPTPRKVGQPINAMWYKRFTNWVLSCPLNTVLTFATLTVMSGFFYGFNAVLATSIAALIFGVWLLTSDTKTMQAKIGGAYSSVAVVLNIVLLLSILVIGTIHTPTINTTSQPETIEITLQ